jgi:GT2 family glycosyltransferase
MREKLMKAAADTDATHLMFIDSDVMFPPDAMEKLLRQQKTLIGATYRLKDQHRKVAAHKPLGTEYGPNREVKLTDTPQVTHEVRAIPTGFMLVDLKAIREIPQPWFDFSPNDDTFMGEDVWFCERVREHGHQIFMDPTIPVGHIGDWVY